MGRRLAARIDEMGKRLDHRIMEMEACLQAVLDRWYASLVWWMFIFWVGQIGVIAALLALL